MSDEAQVVETHVEPTIKVPEVAEVSTEVEKQPETTRDIVEREVKKLEVDGKLRDDKGKFTPKENPKESTKDVDVKEQPLEQKTDAPVKNPFKSWTKEAQARLSTLDPDMQAMIADREDKFHRGIDQYKSDAAFAKTMQRAIAPHSQYMQQLGVTPEVAIDNLLKTERTLRMGSQQEKSQMFQRLAHDYGIDLGELSQAAFDPNQHMLQNKIAQLESQLGNVQASRQSASDAQIAQSIEQFAQSHEFFDEVKDQMANLLDKGMADNLEDSYAKAVRLNDEVFGKYSAAQQNNSQRQQALKADQAAKAAKAVAVSVKGSPTGITHNQTPATTEEAVRLAMRQHGLI